MANMKDKLKNAKAKGKSNTPPPPPDSPKSEKPKEEKSEKRSYNKKSIYSSLSPIAKEQLEAIIGGRLIQYKAYPKNNKLTIALWAELTGAKIDPETGEYKWIIHPRETLKDSKKTLKYIKEFGWEQDDKIST
jgi:hypothetical protein